MHPLKLAPKICLATCLGKVAMDNNSVPSVLSHGVDLFGFLYRFATNVTSMHICTSFYCRQCRFVRICCLLFLSNLTVC